jgi:erythritol transport system ATP-binding protein
MMEPSDMEDVRRRGALGEVLGHFFDINGRPVETEVTQRIVTLPLDKLRNRRLVALAGGVSKVAAIRAALESGLLTGLITDERTARAILAKGDENGAIARQHPGAMAVSP